MLGKKRPKQARAGKGDRASEGDATERYCCKLSCLIYFCRETDNLAWPHLRSKESWDALKLLDVFCNEPYPLCLADAPPTALLWCWSCCHSSPLRPPIGTPSSSARLAAPITMGVLAVVVAAVVPGGLEMPGRCRAGSHPVPCANVEDSTRAHVNKHREEKTREENKSIGTWNTDSCCLPWVCVSAHETRHTCVRANWAALTHSDEREGEARGCCCNTECDQSSTAALPSHRTSLSHYSTKGTTSWCNLLNLPPLQKHP